MRGGKTAWIFAACVAPACADRSLPPLPEVVVAVDTDVAIGVGSTRLRIDLYAEDGTWFESSSFARPDPRDWPVTFGVYSDDDGKARKIIVRMRAYPDGRERDYRGENPHAWGGPISFAPPTANGPRLVKDGVDVTPPSEPDPLVTIDRLGVVETKPGQVTHARFVLHGACVGTSARLGDDPARLALDEAKTCVATERALASLDGATDAPAATPWPAGDPCPPRDDASARVCVPGGATIFGADGASTGALEPSSPVRLLGVSRFFLDRREVTVGRMRDAFARGFKPPYTNYDSDPHAYDAPLDESVYGKCTYSSKALGREDYAVNCVTWIVARAFCQFSGGDLPSELQWEHAATVAGRASKTLYPWGNDAATCDRAAFGGAASGTGLLECRSAGDLPRPADASANDVTPLGILELAGSMAEWTIDDSRPFTDACWGDAPLVDARCGDPNVSANARAVRGGNYALPMLLMTTRLEQSPIRQSIYTGFRCAYPDAGQP